MVELIERRDRTGRPSPLNTILFAKSRRDVHKVYQIVHDNLKIKRPELAKKVRKYVSGDLGAEEKREIYQGLNSGELVGVISTNALEAGIDIGKLDACVIAGFPFWVMRMRQMAGRVGRSQEGLILFVPHPFNTIDQYYRDHPDFLLTQQPEVFVVDPNNPYISRKHINSAAFHLQGISLEELNLFGAKALATAEQAITDGVMRRNGNRYYGTRRNYQNTEDPYVIGSIRSQPQVPYSLCRDHDTPCMRNSTCFEFKPPGYLRSPHRSSRSAVCIP